MWKIFSSEIEYCYINAINRFREETDIGVTLLCILQYLRNQHSIITNALDWIGDCGFGKWVKQPKLFEQIYWNDRFPSLNILFLSAKHLFYNMISLHSYIGRITHDFSCVLQRYEHVVDVIDKRRKMFNIYSRNGTQYI